MNDKKIRKKIQEKLDAGVDKFVIYPYGFYGVEIANMLRDIYDITPVHIVDNTLCKYNRRIIDFVKFKEIYENDWCVILSIENQAINSQMEKELKRFVPDTNIINVRCLSNIGKESYGELENTREVRNQFSLDNILPENDSDIDNYDDIRNRKIKVRLLHTATVMWNSLKTICEAFETDEKYDVLVILNSHISEDAALQMKNENHKYISGDLYDAELDKPDIFIVTMPWAISHISNIRKYAKLVIAALMTTYDYYLTPVEFWKILKRGFEQYKPDYYLLDRGLYSELKEYGYRADKLIEMGNAKYDGIFEACKTKKYPSDWEKLKEKKKSILWITTHGIYDNKISDCITFDLYAKSIFEYAHNNTDIGFIFRPHAAFIGELLKYGYWNDGDLKKIKIYCERTPNIVWDENDSYDAALSVSDAVLVDAFCGVTYSALPTMKPICAMHRSDECSVTYDDKLLDSLYSANNNREVLAFIDMVREDQDTMLEIRKKAVKQYVKHFDGQNGVRIKVFVEEKFFEMAGCMTDGFTNM